MDVLALTDLHAELTTEDRCDRCGAQAHVRAVLPSGSLLLFCGHHGHELHDSLVLAGARVEDRTDRLTARPAA